MKKIVLGLVVSVGLAVSVQAGMWSVISSMGFKKVKPLAKWKLETSGWEPRVYEFNTLSKPIMHCVIIFSSSNKNSSPTMQCIRLDPNVIK